MSILLAEPLGWIRRHLPRLRISLFVLNAPEGGGGSGGGGGGGGGGEREAEGGLQRPGATV